MKKITRWSPDTCDCVIDFEWDTDNPDLPHVGKEIVKACDAHKGNDVSNGYAKVLDENQRKNKAFKLITDNLIDYAKLTDRGESIIDREKVSYYFDADRKLVITAKDIKNQDKTNIQAIIDLNIGTDKVIVNG